MSSFFNIFLIFLIVFLKYILCQQQFGYSNNPFYPPLGNILPQQQQHSISSSLPQYGKSSYFYLTPYGNYGQSGYEGPQFGINSYWQPGIATYPSGYGQKGGFNPAFQCIDQLTDCALQASLGKCSYSPNTLANCPVSCGVSCPTAGGYLPEYNNYLNGGNPLLQSPLSFGAYRDIYSQQYSPQLPYNNAQLDNYNQNNDYNQNYLSTTTPNTFPFFCRDSHIFGCPNWAKLGFCQKVPEYMLNYCRASCGVCDNLMPPFSSSTFKTPKTTLKNNFIPQGNLQFNSGGFGSVLPEPFGGISSNELLQEDNELLPYSHYYYSNSPLRTALGGERKEKQQRLANEGFQQNKFLFNEDDEQQQINSLTSTSSNDFTKQTNLAINSKPSQITSTQNSNISKLIKMDDLLDKIN